VPQGLSFQKLAHKSRLDMWKGALRGNLCPEGGYRAQPRVSTLGTLKINEFALKGQEADLITLAPIAGPKLRVRN
jgi:hypothetical protein